jgi:hypothetical protein
MAYAQFDLVRAADYNTLVGGNPTATANTLNATWATGSAAAGYGQPAEANVTVGNSVAASNWAGLVTKTASAASHQGSSITSVAAPVTGGTVTFLSAIPDNLETIYLNRLNAANLGNSSVYPVTNNNTWNNTATWTHTVSFDNADNARYFFNAGGQIKMSCSHGNTTAGVNQALSTLCNQTGTVVISGQASGTRTVAGEPYNGVTKIGGSGTVQTISTNSGYFGLVTGNTTIFDQNSAISPYAAVMDVVYLARVSGSAGQNQGNGNQVIIHTIFRESGANGTVGTGSIVTCTIAPPSTTHINETWGNITVVGTTPVVTNN